MALFSHNYVLHVELREGEPFSSRGVYRSKARLAGLTVVGQYGQGMAG